MVIDYLELEMARGKTHVLLDQETRDDLRKLYALAKQGAHRGRVMSATSRVEPSSHSSPEFKAEQAAILEEFRKEQRVEAVVDVVKPVIATGVNSWNIAGASKAERLASLAEQAARWSPVRQLGTLSDGCVFGYGNPDAKILFIGDYVKYHDVQAKKPLCGNEGEKYDAVLKAMGLVREDVYTTTVVKFRPNTDKSLNTRMSTDAEIDACLPILLEEIKIVQPMCIVAMGLVPVKALLRSTDIERERGQWHDCHGIPMRVTQNTSQLLMSSKATKRVFWEDLLSVMEKVGMSISDKQKRFFL